MHAMRLELHMSPGSVGRERVAIATAGADPAKCVGGGGMNLGNGLLPTFREAALTEMISLCFSLSFIRGIDFTVNRLSSEGTGSQEDGISLWL